MYVGLVFGPSIHRPRPPEMLNSRQALKGGDLNIPAHGIVEGSVKWLLGSRTYRSSPNRAARRICHGPAALQLSSACRALDRLRSSVGRRALVEKASDA